MSCWKCMWCDEVFSEIPADAVVVRGSSIERHSLLIRAGERAHDLIKISEAEAQKPAEKADDLFGQLLAVPIQ